MTDKSQLRRQMRQIRQAEHHANGDAAAESLAQHLIRSDIFKPSSRIGVYIAIGSEISLDPAIMTWRARGMHLFAPITRDDQPLRFAALENDIVAGPFGTWQPPNDARTIAPAELDVVLVPLLAFDDRGNRLGQGGGFYDRSFNADQKTPLRLGIGYAVQRILQIPTEAHDVTLHAVCTEQGWTSF
jgi:5-formyltetrahydrofolate cyclo-ligase